MEDQPCRLTDRHSLLSHYAAVAQDPDQKLFDYGDYASALKKYVNDRGMVKYSALKADRRKLDAYVDAIARLPRAQYNRWGKTDKIAFWLNAYNGLTLKAIIDHYPIKASFLRSRIYPKNSIRQIAGVWDKMTFTVMGREVTLSHIEHKILRIQFSEPRIHLAMVCAAMGCPPLRNEPYIGQRLDEQLNDQAHKFLSNAAKFKISRGEGRLYLSPIFKWFGGDFVRTYAPARKISGQSKTNAAVLKFIDSYLEGPDKDYLLGGKFKIKYLHYDWSLNEQ